MTPKEKAEEIWSKFAPHSDYGYLSIKSMCVICVDYLIEEQTNNYYFYIEVKKHIIEKL
jgi:hypothetical protein